MTAYIYLIISALSLMGMSILRKEYDKRNKKGLDTSVVFAGLAYLIVFAVSFIVSLLLSGIGEYASLDAFILSIGFGYAFISVVTTILCIIAASYGSVSLILVFARLGNLTIAFIYGLLFDNNKADLLKWIGLGVVLCIIVINFLASDKSAGDGSARSKRIYALLCLAVFFSNGSALLFHRLFTKNRPDFEPLNFVAVYAALSVVIAVIAFFVIKLTKKSDRASGVSLSRVSVWIIVAYAIIMLVGEFTALVNTAILPVIILAPVSFALPMIFASVAERIVYPEQKCG